MSSFKDMWTLPQSPSSDSTASVRGRVCHHSVVHFYSAEGSVHLKGGETIDDCVTSTIHKHHQHCHSKSQPGPLHLAALPPPSITVYLQNIVLHLPNNLCISGRHLRQFQIKWHGIPSNLPCGSSRLGVGYFACLWVLLRVLFVCCFVGFGVSLRVNKMTKAAAKQ